MELDESGRWWRAGEGLRAVLASHVEFLMTWPRWRVCCSNSRGAEFQDARSPSNEALSTRSDLTTRKTCVGEWNFVGLRDRGPHAPRMRNGLRWGHPAASNCRGRNSTVSVAWRRGAWGPRSEITDTEHFCLWSRHKGAARLVH